MNLILEFNASRRYSHHWSYVNKYKTLIQELDKPFEIWIPKNAHPDIISVLGSNTKAFLQSNVYGYERKENFFNWFVVKLTDLLLQKSRDMFSRQKIEHLKNKLSKFYTNEPYKRIKSLCQTNSELSLIFPTMDSLAFRLVERVLKKKLMIKRICFRLGSGYKDSYKIDEIETRILKLIDEFPDCDIRIGFETYTHRQYLLDRNMPAEKLFWAPAPPTSMFIGEREKQKTLTLGFLGVARPNKGFTEIPNLLKFLRAQNISFQAFVQKAIYPWSGYLEAMQEIKDFATILPANISQDQLDDVFKKIDILVLPYNIDNYKIAGSGLLFAAADLNVPTFAKKGVAFEWDINEYCIGSIFEDDVDFVVQIKEFLYQRKQYNFTDYNSDRYLSVVDFLGLNPDKL